MTWKESYLIHFQRVRDGKIFPPKRVGYRFSVWSLECHSKDFSVTEPNRYFVEFFLYSSKNYLRKVYVSFESSFPGGEEILYDHLQSREISVPSVDSRET